MQISHKERQLIKKRQKEFEAITGSDLYKTPGHFRKRHPLNCGNAECCVCHFEKVSGIKSHKQRIADLNFQEQMNGC